MKDTVGRQSAKSQVGKAYRTVFPGFSISQVGRCLCRRKVSVWVTSVQPRISEAEWVRMVCLGQGARWLQPSVGCGGPSRVRRVSVAWRRGLESMSGVSALVSGGFSEAGVGWEWPRWPSMGTRA